MASEEKSFENVNGWMGDGRKVITIANPEHSSAELKTFEFSKRVVKFKLVCSKSAISVRGSASYRYCRP